MKNRTIGVYVRLTDFSNTKPIFNKLEKAS